MNNYTANVGFKKEFNPILLTPQDTFLLRMSIEQLDVSGILKSVLQKGVSFIPTVGPALSFMIGFFWPQKKSDLWQQVLDLVDQKIRESELKVIRGILSGDLAYKKMRMEAVATMMEKSPGTPETRATFNNLADEFYGFQEKFSSFKEDDSTNYLILPMYSITVMLELVYWINGLEKKDQLGLSYIEVAKLEGYVNETFDTARKYIEDMYKEKLEDAYENSPGDDIVNNVMSVHGYCQLNGVEYISIWRKIKEAQSISKQFYVDVLTYSIFFGRQTPKLKYLALTDAEDMPPPFRPNIVNGKRTKIRHITGCITRIGGTARVGGLKLDFEDGSTYDLGTITGETRSISLNGSTITSVEVWGRGAIDELRFNLSDGRVFSFGEMGTTNYMRFSISEEHHIAGMFLSSDATGLARQAANFGVSYQLNEDFELKE